MATSAANQLVGLSSIVNTINGLSGRKQTQSGTTTTTQKSDITDEGLQRIINTMLAGNGGVKDISGAARGAGLYNSTTEAQLLNDLTTRVSGEAAARSAGTTQTSTTNQTVATPGMNLSSLAIPAAGLLAASQLGNISSGVSSLASSLGLGGGGGAITAGSGTNLAGLLSGGAALGGAGITAGANAAANVGGQALSSLAGLTSTGAAGATNAVAGAAGDSLASFLGSAGGAGAVPVAGNVLAGLLGGTKAASDPASLGTAALTGALTMGPIGLAAAPLAMLGGGLLKDVSVICTALRQIGKLNADLYKLGQSYLQTLHPFTKQGYYLWAGNVAKKIYAGNERAIRICQPWAESRMMLLASKGTFRDHIKYFRGTLTKVVGQPGCFLIGAGMALIGKKAETPTTPYTI